MLQATILIAALFASNSPRTFIAVVPAPLAARNTYESPARKAAPNAAPDAAPDAVHNAIARCRALADEIIAASYPELKGTDIRVKTFHSQSDYFKARFGYPQYFFARMRYLLFVNPRAFELQAPDAAVRAIVVHELAHVVYFKRRNRVRLLGLVRLASKRFTAEFERWADLKAISLGYGDGLKEYRRWLYRNIPASKLAEKRRNYFSPDEIDAILSASRKRPELLEYWLEHVPLSLNQIQSVK